MCNALVEACRTHLKCSPARNLNCTACVLWRFICIILLMLLIHFYRLPNCCGCCWAHKSTIDMPRPPAAWSIDCTYSMSKFQIDLLAGAHISYGSCDRLCLIAVCNYCSPPVYRSRLTLSTEGHWQQTPDKVPIASAASQSPSQAAGHSSLLHWNRHHPRRHRRRRCCFCLARCHLPVWPQSATTPESSCDQATSSYENA